MSDYEHPSSLRGNDPARWSKLLGVLDERLQFGLLDQLKKIQAYHFEAEVLYLEAASAEAEQYLLKNSVTQQLSLFAETVGLTSGAKVRKVFSK